MFTGDGVPLETRSQRAAPLSPTLQGGAGGLDPRGRALSDLALNALNALNAVLGSRFLSSLPQQWKLIRLSLDRTSSFVINYYFSEANSQCSIRGLLNGFTFSTFSNR